MSIIKYLGWGPLSNIYDGVRYQEPGSSYTMEWLKKRIVEE